MWLDFGIEAMPTEEQIREFHSRDRASPRGKYYVTDQCLDCDLCRETAPAIFMRNDFEGTSYVLRQPITDEEIRQVEESLEGCCTEAIKSDGLEHDWDSNTRISNRALSSSSAKPGKSCCAKKSRPWWRFW